MTHENDEYAYRFGNRLVFNFDPEIIASIRAIAEEDEKKSRCKLIGISIDRVRTERAGNDYYRYVQRTSPIQQMLDQWIAELKKEGSPTREEIDFWKHVKSITLQSSIKTMNGLIYDRDKSK